MNIIKKSEFFEFCAKSKIEIADSNLNIGQYLSFKDSPWRTLVVYAIRNDIPTYLQELFLTILETESSWLLCPRYRYHGGLNHHGNQYHDEILSFDCSELNSLRDILVDYWEARNFCYGDDLYIISESGDILISYDHHLEDTGLIIFLNDIEKTGKLLVVLNTLGAEIQLYSKMK